MLQFQTVGNTLKVSNESATVFSISKKDVYYIQSSLNEDVPKISLYNLNVGVFAVVFQALLSDCSDPNGDPFTVNSFTTFAEDNLGFNSGGTSPSITVTDSYATLPDPTTVSGQFYWCENADGTFPVGLYYSDGTAWQFQTSENITVVANYSALPDPTTVSGQFFWAESSQGTSWLPAGLGGTYYSAGMYYSNGVSWSFIDVPYQATQSEVNAGTNNNKFVTPSTLKNQNYLGTVTSVSALTLGTSGTDLSSTVANGTTTPTITLNVPTASATNRGALSSTDWTTFNNKQNNLRTFQTTQGVYYFNEFMGSLAANVTAATNDVINTFGNGQGTTRGTSTITNRTNQQGVVESLTSANNTGQAGWQYGGTALFIGTGVITLETYVNITTLSTLAERFYTFFGYATGSNYANILNNIAIVYDEGGVYLSANASPNFKCITRAGSTVTTTVTSIAVTAGQWYKLRININAAASSVEFYIDNVLRATHNTNIPLTTTPMFIGNGIIKNTGSTARAMQTDYFMYEEIFTNPR